jgi:hypothetical protein
MLLSRHIAEPLAAIQREDRYYEMRSLTIKNS